MYYYRYLSVPTSVISVVVVASRSELIVVGSSAVRSCIGRDVSGASFVSVHVVVSGAAGGASVHGRCVRGLQHGCGRRLGDVDDVRAVHHAAHQVHHDAGRKARRHRDGLRGDVAHHIENTCRTGQGRAWDEIS